MSRAGYCDDWDETYNLYRGSVDRALQGKRGQAFLRELIAALDALPVKELISASLVETEEMGPPCFCALGAVYHARGVSIEDISSVDQYDWETLSKELNIAESMAREIMWMNDEAGDYAIDGTPMTDAKRWRVVRAWAERELRTQQRGQSREE